MTITIRPATISDAYLVADFVNRLTVELSGGAPRPSAEEWEPVARALLEDPATYAGFVAEDGGGTALGILMLNACAAVYAGGRFGEISELYVVPEHRSQGVAVALVTAAIDEARRRGWRHLEVGAPSLPAWRRTVDFYLREGFTTIGPRLVRKL